jgi:hypothetical protein
MANADRLRPFLPVHAQRQADHEGLDLVVVDEPPERSDVCREWSVQDGQRRGHVSPGIGNGNSHPSLTDV